MKEELNGLGVADSPNATENKLQLRRLKADPPRWNWRHNYLLQKISSN
ncbi:MAG: hypothetical protein BAJATHORv1_30519 [Candidatus Thorarchaeota archaeon]|nr:MAG: hypothetical protein BAJATHORv1_30519 [Candidatus Thorarchaeota archaeon]